MNRRLYLACLALGLFAALAQSEDVFLERYTLALDSLDRSVDLLPTDGAQSLDNLERAARTLRPLSETTSPTFTSAMENTFERARAAIRNGSQTDLAVQVAVLKGGFRRLLYEAAVRQANAGDIEGARRRLATMAIEMALPAETQNALSGSFTAVEPLRLSFERGVAAAVLERLERVREGAGSELDSAYRTLADAYSLFIPIQDSPHLSASANEAFGSAIGALVAQDGEALGSTLDQLGEEMRGLLEASVQTVTQEEEAGESAETSPTETAQAEIDAPRGEIENLAAQAETGGAAASEEAEVAALEPAALEPAPLTTPAEGVSQEEDAALMAELASYGLDEEGTRGLLTSYRQSGVGSVGGALETLYAAGAKAVLAASAGDQEAARELVGAFGEGYSRLLGPLVAAQDGSLNRATLALVESLVASPALRLQEVVVLLGQAEAAAAALSGSAPSSSQALEVQTSLVWTGFLRLTLMIFLGLLAFVPLYLLRLAFGGGNRNWQWLGASLFLLLLPTIYEGLGFLGNLIADAAGLEAFTLARFSIFQNTLAQLVWAALTGIAILFATFGLYGICVQFGLLRRRSRTAETQPAAAEGGPDTAIDWDEEF